MQKMAKILVVDDQFGLRRLLFEAFREDQHEVEMASNGTEALQLFISSEPDLILMDMKNAWNERYRNITTNPRLRPSSGCYYDDGLWGYSEHGANKERPRNSALYN